MASQDIKSNNLVFSPAPHIHLGSCFTGAMLTYIVVLLPVVAFAIKMYGWDAARVISVAVSSAMLFELLFQKMLNQAKTFGNGNAALIGLVLALIMPPSIPWWTMVMGCFMAIFVGKLIFGGTGGNPFNPVLIGWASIRISWPDYINFDLAMVKYDLPSIDYPLSILKKVGASGLTDFNIQEMFMGNQIGGMGAAMTLLLLIGGLILIIRGVISWEIPVFFLAGVALTALIFWSSDSAKFASPLFHIVAGNVMIGAFFLATESSSSPINRTAMIIYGLGCGIFTVIFRTWSKYPDGVIFALLMMNMLNPLLDKIKPKVPGKVKVKA